MAVTTIDPNLYTARVTSVANDFGETILTHSHAAGEWLSYNTIDYGRVAGPIAPRGVTGYSYNGISDTDVRAMMNTAAQIDRELIAKRRELRELNEALENLRADIDKEELRRCV